MATFYLLPSRLALGQRFGDFLSTVFPGLRWGRAAWPDLAELLGAEANGQPGAYVVFREDLADEHHAEETLERDFGAEAGDEIVEVHAAGVVRRWTIGAAV
jgi:hypothetical protein